ncbi:MAG: hypothetical protein KDB79_01200 [Acidobacteria bacterium]|nr:hypothetical protein [Acidobacteriota bacterium]
MFTRPPFFARVSTVILIVFLLEVPGLFAQTIPPDLQKLLIQQQPTGKMVYEVTADSEAHKWLKRHPGVAPEDFDAGLRDGVLWAVKMTGECTKPDGGKSAIGDSWALSLDEDSKKSLLTTNQKDQTASIRLSGIMRHWRRNGCTGEFRELASGIGGIRADYKTTMHTTSRTFQALAGRDDVAKNKYLDAVKDARLNFLKHLPQYYRDIKKYQMNPKFKFVDTSQYNQLSPGDFPPAPAGAVSDDNAAVIIGEGFGNAVKALNIWDSVKSPEDAAATVGGMAREFTITNIVGPALSMAVAEATNAHEANIIRNELPQFLSSPVEYLYDKGVAEMVQSVAAVNKMYADNGDPQAQQIQRDATKRTSFEGKEYQYVDADYMAKLTLNAYNDEIKRLEKERELEDQLPPSAVRGMIWGPGIYEPIRAWSQNIGGSVAGSFAPHETKIDLKDPRLVAALKKSGRDISQLEKLSQDVKPIFSSLLYGREMIKDAAPKLQVMIYLGSPKDTYKPLVFGPTIFDPPFTDDEKDNGKDKPCRFVLSLYGNDSGTGAAESPFATMQKALDESNKCRNRGKAAIVFVKNGVYRQAAVAEWNDTPQKPELRIEGESTSGVVFTSAEVSSAVWESTAAGFTADSPIHPDQPAWAPSTNLTTNPAPVVIVNGQRLRFVHFAKNIPVPGYYSFRDNKIDIRPQEGVTDINSATIEVGVRPFALKMTGVRNATISNMTFRFFQLNSGNDSAGIIATGSEVALQGLKFQ